MEKEPSTAGGIKRSIPKELQDEMDETATKLPRVTATPAVLDDNQKRYLVVGICLHSVISPALRKYIVPILSALYEELTLKNNIDTQTYSAHLKKYQPTSTKLNYKAVNNNEAACGKANYDYKIKSVVDLSKLFLLPHMAHYTGFDETCDSSALLTLFIIIDKFPAVVKSDAEDVREVRNQWAHCDFTQWDAVKYSNSFRLMTNLVMNLSLSSTEENQTLLEMKKWEIDGPSYLNGTNEICRLLLVVVESLKYVAKETDTNSLEIKAAQENYKTLSSTLTQLKTDMDTRCLEINNTLLAIKNNQDTLLDSQKDVIGFWKEQEVTFVETPVVHRISKILESEHCVLIVGEPGIGKSMLLHNVALKLQKKIDYTIIPCSGMQDILKQYKEGKRQMFVLDDICGQFTVSMSKIEQWMNDESTLRRIMNKGGTKVAATCRLDIYNNEKFQISYTVFKPNIFNLSHEYSREDKLAICNKYLSQTNIQLLKDQNVDFTPLMCYLYSKNENFNLTDFLESPFEIYQKEWDKLKTFDEHKYCSLLLCVIYNGVMNKSLFETYNENNKKNKLVWKIIFDVCKIDRSTSRSKIDSVMESLIGTYLKKTKNEYRIIHDQMFDFMCCYFGNKDTMVKCILRYSDIRVLNQRTQLESINEQHSKFTIMISKKDEQEYFERIKSEVERGKMNKCFNNTQMKYKVYRNSFLKTLRSIDDKLLIHQIYQREETHLHSLADTGSKDYNDEIVEGPFIKSCLWGYYDIYKYFMSKDVDIKTLDSIHTPLTAACSGGNEKIVQSLIVNGSEVNQMSCMGLTPLTVACNRGNEKIAKLLIDNGSDVNHGHSIYLTPLTAACSDGNKTIVQLLIEKGSDVNQPGRLGQTSLTAACSEGHEEIVKVLIDRGSDVNQGGVFGQTPLMAACSGGNEAIVQLLIDNGSDVNQGDRMRQTPLTVVCSEGHEEIVKLLINKGSDVNQSGLFGETPLIAACSGGNIKIVKLLIDRGSNVNQGGEFGHTPLVAGCIKDIDEILKYYIDTWALADDTFANNDGKENIIQLLIDRGGDSKQVKCMMQTPLTSASNKGHEDIVKLLIDKGSDLNQNDAMGQTPLTAACDGGNEKIVNLLIDKGTDVNQVDREGQTPLISACRNGHEKIVKLLIDKGSDVNQVNNMSETPLTAACSEGHVEIVQLLINKESDVNKVAGEEQTPLTRACSVGHEQIVKLLIDKGSDVNQADCTRETPLTAGCSQGHEEIVKFLIIKGSDVNQVDGMGKTPLISACRGGNAKIVHLLIDKGSDVNQVDRDGQTPLITACNGGREEIVQLLIDKGSDVNQVNNISETPLTAACSAGHEKIVQLLIDEEIDVNQVNFTRETPLDIACRNGHEKIVKLLIDKESDVNQVYDMRETPLNIACRKGHVEIVELLIDKGCDINLVDGMKQTPLMAACSVGHDQLVKLLIDKGSVVNKVDCTRETPLTTACSEGHDYIVKLLIENESDINQVDAMGQTPLTAACAGGNKKIVHLLIDTGSDVNQVDRDGQTPLISACKCGSEELVQLLIDKGSDVNQVDDKGQTPLMAARYGENEKIIQIIIEKGNEFKQIASTYEGDNEEILYSRLDHGSEINHAGAL